MICAAGPIVVSAQRRDEDLDGSPSNTEEPLHIVVGAGDSIQQLLGKVQSLSAERGVIRDCDITANPHLGSGVVETCTPGRSNLLRGARLAFSAGGKKLFKAHMSSQLRNLFSQTRFFASRSPDGRS